jgi:hypothetical protein
MPVPDTPGAVVEEKSQNTGTIIMACNNNMITGQKEKAVS